MKFLIEDLISGLLPENQYPTMNALPYPIKKKKNAPLQLPDPNNPNPAEKVAKKHKPGPLKKVIVYVIGGVTHAETIIPYSIAQRSPVNVYVGGCSVMSPSDLFLDIPHSYQRR